MLEHLGTFCLLIHVHVHDVNSSLYGVYFVLALELQPKDALSLKYHAEVLSYLGRKEEAKEQFMEAAHVE